MSDNNVELPYNPFNPIKTYRLYSSKSSTQHIPQRFNSVKLIQQTNHNNINSSQNSHYALFLRNQENKGLKSDKNFDAYIKKLEDNCKISKKLIQQTKKQIKQEQQQNQQQEEEVKKQVQYIRNTAKEQKKEKFQHQITEMIAEIKSPNYKKGRYLLNDDKEKEKKLAKPLFFGIQYEAIQKKQRRKQIYSQIDINKLRYKIFFDDDLLQSKALNTQQSVIQQEIINESPQTQEQARMFFNNEQ